MALFATIYDSLSFGNVLLLLLLLLMLHYLMLLYEFRNMPPGPRFTALPILGNAFSLDSKAEKLTDTFKRSVHFLQCHRVSLIAAEAMFAYVVVYNLSGSILSSLRPHSVWPRNMTHLIRTDIYYFILVNCNRFYYFLFVSCESGI